MAVHRGDQRGWARRNGARSVPAWGHRLNRQFAVCPTSPAHRVRDNGTARSYLDPAPSVTSAVYLACLQFFLAFLLLARRERL